MKDLKAIIKMYLLLYLHFTVLDQLMMREGVGLPFIVMAPEELY